MRRADLAGSPWIQGGLLLGLALAFSLAATAQAGVSNEVFVFEASNSSGSASQVVKFKAGTWDATKQKLTWTLAAPVALVDADNGNTVCTLRAANVTLRKHARFNVTCEFDAGDSETTISMRPALLSFPEVGADAVTAQASASVMITDRNDNGSYARAVGGDGAPIFRAAFNGQAPGGSTYTELLGSVEGGAGGVASASQTDPPFGYRAVGAAVHDLSLRFAMVVSAGDRFSFTGAYRIQPEPSCNDGDADGDLTPNCLDDCPNDGGKINPGDCGCGTSDVDSDGDGVLDCDDDCPDGGEPGPCGCGVAATDTDGDGTPDCNDGCPNDSGKTSPGQCGCGVAETDSDGDGTADCNDVNPNDAESGGGDDDDAEEDGGSPADDGNSESSDDSDDGSGNDDGDNSDVETVEDQAGGDGDSADTDEGGDDGVAADESDEDGVVAGEIVNQDGSDSGSVVLAPTINCGAGLAAAMTLSLLSLAGAKRRVSRR